MPNQGKSQAAMKGQYRYRTVTVVSTDVYGSGSEYMVPVVRSFGGRQVAGLSYVAVPEAELFMQTVTATLG